MKKASKPGTLCLWFILISFLRAFVCMCVCVLRLCVNVCGFGLYSLKEGGERDGAGNSGVWN